MDKKPDDAQQLSFADIYSTASAQEEPVEQAVYRPIDVSNLMVNVTLSNTLLDAGVAPELSLNASKLRDGLISQLPSFPSKELEGIPPQKIMNDFKYMRIKVSEIAENVGWSNKNSYTVVKSALEELATKPYKFEYIDKRTGKKNIFSATLVASYFYQSGCGYADVELSTVLSHYLVALKNKFTMWQLGVSYKFTNITNKRLYELLAQYRSIGHRSFTYPELKKQLYLEDKYKTSFYNFKQRVLVPACQEASSVSDLLVRFDVTGRGNNAVINFSFRPKEAFTKKSKDIPKSFNSDDLELLMDLVKTECHIENITTDDATLRNLCMYALTFFRGTSSDKVSNAYFCFTTAKREYIQRLTETHIDNKPAYFRKILEVECRAKSYRE